MPSQAVHDRGSFVAAALFALVTAFAFQAHSVSAHPMVAEESTEPSVVLTGTVTAVVIGDRVHNTTTEYRELRLDDGTVAPLLGAAATSLQDGARVALGGRRAGVPLEVTSAEVLAAAPPSTAPSAEIEGTLAIAHGDDFAAGKGRYFYQVHSDAGAVTTLAIGSLPMTLRGGSRVIVSGKPGADVSSLSPQTITILAEPPGASGPQSELVAKAATINTVLVIMANYNNAVAPSFTQTQAQQVMTTNAGSVGNFYADMSYGQQLLNVTVTNGWLTINMAQPSTCDWSNIGTAADAAATAAGLNPANYGYVVYLFPWLSSCGWSGLAYVGSPHKAYINGTGSFGTQVVAHEMGHNFGLWHAGSVNCGAATIGGTCSVAEYGDPWDTMGNQRAMHFNAMQKSRLGWIPATSVKTHTSGSASYTLSPLETGGATTYAVKIPTSSSQRTYWLEFRQPLGFDAALANYPNLGAQIRVASPFEWSSGSDDTEILDMTPGSTGGFGDSALLAGHSYIDSVHGINIIVTSATTTALTVSVTTSSGAATTTTLVSSLNPSTVGGNVTFTATVTGTNPTGSVNFTNGGTSITGCSAIALSGTGNSRTAACTTNALTGGAHSIVAIYGGDAANAPSSSSTLSQGVNKVTSTTGIGTSLTPSTAGTSVTFTATVSGTAPTGTVNFKDGTTSISGCSAAAVAGSGNIRTATCATGALTVGTHSITAVYSGDASNNTSTSAALSQVVNKATSSTTLSSSGNPVAPGINVTFTASVSGFNPTGAINFTDAGTSISGCSAVALAGSGNTRTATCTTNTLATGTHSVVASYGGDANNTTSSSSTLSQSVNKVTSTTGIGTSLTPSTAGTSVTFTATVSGTAPTGTVNFKDGTTSISGCSAAAVAGSGNIRTATCATGALTVGTHSITAVYSGDASNNTSTSAALSQVVNNPTSSTTLVSSLNPSTVGGNVTFTATVTGTNPTGPVNFTNGGTSITGCSAIALSGTGNSRTAACTTNALTGGAHSIVAIYGGDAANAPSSSSTLSQSVNKVTSTTGIGTSLTPSTAGTSVTFTATVSGTAPTGTVNFKDGTTSISGCSATAVAGSGNIRTATCATGALTIGTHSITAAYSGDASNNTSTSAALSQVVNKATSSTTLSSSGNPVAPGINVTFTASVSGFNPTGAINFTDAGTSISGCSAVALAGSGNTRTATCTTNTLATGTHSVVASYGGDANNTTSSSATWSQAISSAAPPAALVNAGFETPALGSGYLYNPTGAGIGWTFSAMSGIQHNGSAWGAASAPEGVQTAFIQSTGSISQALSLNAGNYTLAFKAAQRACCLSPNTQPIKVTVDGIQIGGLVTPASTSFGNVSIPFTVASGGTHTLAFVGTTPNSNATFIDAVTLSAVVPGTTLASSLNPAKRGQSVTFTATVIGTNPTGTVGFTSNASPITGCTAVAFSAGSGNVRTAKCTTSFATSGSFNIVAHYNGDGSNAPSSSAPLSETIKSKQ